MVVSYRVDAAAEQLLRVSVRAVAALPQRQVMVEGVRSADDVNVTLDTFELGDSGDDAVSNVTISVNVHRDNREHSIPIVSFAVRRRCQSPCSTRFLAADRGPAHAPSSLPRPRPLSFSRLRPSLDCETS